MSGNTSHKARSASTRQLAVCALLCALNVVLARFLTFMPSGTVRPSIEAIPIVLAGYFFGPTSGMIVGFLGDTIGCLFSPYGWNPLLCVSPMLIGAFAGLLRPLVREIKKTTDIWRIMLTLLPGKLLGSIVWNSLCFVWLGFSSKGLWFLMASRLLEVSIEWVVVSVLLLLLLRTNIFIRAGLFPLAKAEKAPKNWCQIVAYIMLLLELIMLCAGDLMGRLDFLKSDLPPMHRFISGTVFALPLIISIVLFVLSAHCRKTADA